MKRETALNELAANSSRGSNREASLSDAATPNSEVNGRLVRGWRKRLLLALAGLFFVLGAAGTIIPGLPATPFLLLTSYFLVRTSPRLNAILLRSRLFGPLLVDWQEHGGVKKHVKVKAIGVVIVAVAIAIYLSSHSVWVMFAIASLATVGIVVILRLPDLKQP